MAKNTRKSWIDIVAEYKALLASKRASKTPTVDQILDDKAEFELLIGGKAEKAIETKLSQDAINGLHKVNNYPAVYGNSIALMTCPTGQGLAVFAVQSNENETGYNFGTIAFYKQSVELYANAEKVNHPRFGGEYVYSASLRGGLRGNANGGCVRFNREITDFEMPTPVEKLVVDRLIESRDKWQVFDRSLIEK